MAPGTDIVPLSSGSLMPTERLESEITELAAHIHAATARWLMLVAEYDSRMAWADWDCKSCAHWLAWRCGLGMRAAREHVRVARSLVELPQVRREFEQGRFSFSQVRALTRVATPENEGELVEVARCAPATQLEGMVRAFRGALRAQEVKEAKRRQVTRHLTYYFDEDGSFVIRGRLSPEEGAIVEKTLDSLAEGLEEEGCSAEHLENEIANDVLEELGEKAFGATKTDTFDARAMNERDEARQKFFNAASSHDYARRRADALVMMAEASLTELAHKKSCSDRYQVLVHVNAEALVDDTIEGLSELSTGTAMATETVRRLLCESSIVSVVEEGGSILSVGRKTRSIPTAIKRALLVRDRHCRFPGCTNKAWMDAHHIKHWVHGGHTELENLCLLCRAHHRAVHEYGYDVKVVDGNLVFYRPDGSVIAAPPPITSQPHKVVSLNHAAGIEIDDETSVPTNWYGEQWDYDITVAQLMDDPELVPTGP